MRIAITGASGLIGSHLAAFLAREGWQVQPLVRRRPQAGSAEVFWDPARGEVDAAPLDGVDGVVHLAGHAIAGLWTRRHKALVRESRVQGTQVLAAALARLARPPRVLVSASAEGFYGDRGDEVLTEDSAPGTGFLAEVCQAWEAAAGPARAAGIRVVHPRIGLVLAAHGGALQALLRPFRLGLGGRFGDGRQIWSWIALTDVVRAIHHLVLHADLVGPVNAVAPNPVSNSEFVRALGAVVRRPTIVGVPAWLLRAALGEMGRQMLLRSARLRPARLEATGFAFTYPRLADALRGELGAP